ncbi:MAG: hypothetical protein IJC47_01680 [Alistipes sp.]|nr:hypothetical protein [Alistipes sp.]
MKKLFLILFVALFATTLAAQEHKKLTLVQTADAAYQQQLIDAAQKQVIDSMIVKLGQDRKALEREKRANKISAEDYKATSKSLSQTFTNELKQILGGPEGFRKWQAIRQQGQ